MTEQNREEDLDVDNESADGDAKLPGYTKPAPEALHELRENAEDAEQAAEDDA